MIFGIFELYVIIVVGSLFAATLGGVVTIKIIRNRREAKKRRLRKPRNSLQKYPSFVANKITGQITILPAENYCGKEFHPMMSQQSQQYLIAIGPPIDFYTSSLSFFDRMYPGRAVRDDGTCKNCKDLDNNDRNNNVIFF